MSKARTNGRRLLVAAALAIGSVSQPAAAQTTTDSTTCSACIDVSIGSDHNARLLQFDAATGQMSLESVDGAGFVTQTRPFGPFAGWTARATATGADSLTRVLWTHADGSAALWLVAPLGGVGASFRYPGTEGLTRVDVAAGARSETHILSIRTDGAAVIQTIDASGAMTRSLPFGPYAGWRAAAISDGPEGLTRILWNNLDGRVGLSLVSPDGNLTTVRYGPDAGWKALDVAVGGDGLTRILRGNADGRVGLWIVNAAGEIMANGPLYASPGGMIPRRMATGSDGSSRILFTDEYGGAVFWIMTSGGSHLKSFDFEQLPPEGTTSWDVILRVTDNTGPDFCIYTPSVGMIFETTYELRRNADSLAFLHPQDPVDWDEYTATLNGGRFGASYPPTYSAAGMCTHYLQASSLSGSFTADGRHFTATEIWQFTLSSGEMRVVTFHWSGTRQ